MQWIRRHRPSPGTAFGLAALVIALGGAAFAAIPSSDGTISACYHKSNGNVRLVESAGDCRSSESAVSWNQRGPAGPPGEGNAEVVALERTFIADGETKVLFKRGSLTLTARCMLNQPGPNGPLIDIADILISTTKPGSFYAGGNSLVEPSQPKDIAEARLFHSGPTTLTNRDVEVLLAGAPDEPDLHGSLWAGLRQVGHPGCAFGGHVVVASS